MMMVVTNPDMIKEIIQAVKFHREFEMKNRMFVVLNSEIIMNGSIMYILNIKEAINPVITPIVRAILMLCIVKFIFFIL
jgi:hypothetical protein